MRIKYEGECCEDCAQYLANGEASPRHAAKVATRLGDDEQYASIACGDDCEGPFSWASCEACGSTLGGARHRFVVLTEES